MALDGLDPALLTGVFENAPELVSLSARDGRILHLNPAGLALVGAPSLDAVLRLTTANFFSDVGLLAAPPSPTSWNRPPTGLASRVLSACWGGSRSTVI
ncbi:PAS domain-containing protein [Rhodococcus sp. UNC23MFCrub1.1]|uniref:PAS domain-containing protein n=1 Tax=Rhodococcus sp. UNC23MFCrub1.1 TaxID=1449068 RepID=UPI000A7472AC|nr:PAS domain-containing protein [Rhodococcus sp. UNC23MFCrub1.1]